MKKELSIGRLQWLFWLLLFGVNLLTLLRFDSLFQAAGYSFLMVSSFMIIVYTNANWLLPGLYTRGKYFWYVLAVLLLLFVSATYRSLISWWFYDTFFATEKTPFTFISILGSMATAILVYIASILLYVGRRYLHLREQQEVLLRKHTEAELKLLKAQVQPHFLFNVLNNIYAQAQRESPETAVQVEELSFIMRYFVEEAPKDRIPLITELTFVRNYISLEKKRMRYPLKDRIELTGDMNCVLVPPMLLIPLVENVVKHGIDKRREDNFMELFIAIHSSAVQISVRNRVVQSDKSQSGTGLQNLEGRLQLLFQKGYELKAGANQEGLFEVCLTLPYE